MFIVSVRLKLDSQIYLQKEDAFAFLRFIPGKSIQYLSSQFRFARVARFKNALATRQFSSRSEITSTMTTGYMQQEVFIMEAFACCTQSQSILFVNYSPPSITIFCKSCIIFTQERCDPTNIPFYHRYVSEGRNAFLKIYSKLVLNAACTHMYNYIFYLR